MSKKRELNFSSMAAIHLGEDDAPRREVQILKAGEFVHPSTGRAVKITPEHLAAFKENFDAGARGIDVAINYEHGQSMAHGTMASGWFRSLSIKNQGTELWAEIEWTETALSHIRQKEYRYFSVEISFDYVDNMTGKKWGPVLTGGALTNTPVVKGMEPIAASENPHSEENEVMTLAELKAKALELGIDLSEIQAKAAKVELLTTQLSEMKTELSEAKTKLAATESKLATAEASNKALSEQVTAQKKEVAETKFSALVEKGMKEGKLTKAFAEGRFRKVFETMGLEEAEAMLSEMPKVVDLEGSKGHGGGSDAKLTSEQAGQKLSEIANELVKTKGLSLGEAAMQARRDNPELAKQYDQLGR